MTITRGRYLATLFSLSVVVVWVGTMGVAVWAATERRVQFEEQNERQHRAHSLLDENSSIEAVPLLRSAGTAHPWMPYVATGYAHGCTCVELVERFGRTVCRHSTKKSPGSNGMWPAPGFTIAAPSHLAFGTRVEIKFRESDELSFVRVVGDRGDAIGPGRIDVFEGSCDIAREWERRRVLLRVLPAE